MTKRAAYTKIDVLVSVMCVSVFIPCLGAVGINGREMAKRKVCASNVNQNLEAMFAYANESDGELPQIPTFGAWIQDLPYIHAYRFMQDYGMHKEAFYCPSNQSQQGWMDAYFYFNISPRDPSNYNVSSFIIAGYVYLLETQGPWIRPSIAGHGNKQWLGSIYANNPDEAELVIDSTFSLPRTGYPYGDFQHIVGGIFAGMSASGTGAGVYDSSNHLKSAAEPWGGNIGYLDGHVDWRPFSEMERRYPLSILTWWW